MSEQITPKKMLFGSEVDELIAIARKNLPMHPTSVIADCKLMLKFMLVHRPQIYELIGEAQIILKEYKDAENSFQTAIILGNNSESNYLILARLVSSRGDEKLASSYASIGRNGSPKYKLKMTY